MQTTERTMKENKARKVLIFCSDHHIGGDGKLDTFDNTREFTNFIEKIEREHKTEQIELILLGDFFELLRITPKRTKNKIEVMLEKPEYKAMFNKIKQFSKKNKVIYLIGNHDQEMYWNKDIQRTLTEYGITITGKENLTYTHTFKHNTNTFTVYAEHGNQFDPQNSFVDWNSKNETPLGHHLITDFANKVGRLEKESGREWLHDTANVRPLELLPVWFMSNYFYEELNRILKLIAVPILLGFIITRLLPIYFLLQLFNIKFFKLSILPKPLLITLLVIIGIDITLIILFIVFSIIKRDVFKTLRRYGITKYDEIMRKRHSYYTAIAKQVLEGKKITIQPQETIDFFLHGHTHEAEMKKMAVNAERKEKGHANTGSWHKGITKAPTMFGFPPVFVPKYELTYIKIFQRESQIVAQQWMFGKRYALELTPLQKLATFGKKVKSDITKETSIVKEITFEM